MNKKSEQQVIPLVNIHTDMPAKKRSRSRSPKAGKSSRPASGYILFVMKAAEVFEEETGMEANRFALAKAIKEVKAWNPTTESRKGSGDIEKFRRSIPKIKAKVAKN